MARYIPLTVIVALLVLCIFGFELIPWLALPGLLLGGLALLGIYDMFQTKHTLWRNFPIIARVRWIAEELRPFFRAYIVESETEGRPFNHEERAMVYRRAKNVSSVEPFGSQLDIDKPPYEWLAHSMAAKHPKETDPRVLVGAKGTAKPYSSSVFNISAMSYGALSARAIESLNRGRSQRRLLS